MFPHPIARHLISYIIHNIIDNEEYHRYDDRSAQTSLSDNRSQWGANEKENKARERNGKFPVPLYPMAINGLLHNCFIERPEKKLIAIVVGLH